LAYLTSPPRESPSDTPVYQLTGSDFSAKHTSQAFLLGNFVIASQNGKNHSIGSCSQN